MKYKEIHNFFDNPDEVRELALSFEYDKCTRTFFPGKRTKDLGEDSFIYEKIVSTVIRDLNEFSWVTFDLSLSFQYTDKDTICNEHTDGNGEEKYGFAGVVYLNPELPEGDYGTTIGGTKVSNEYNKLVYYDQNILHKPTGTFGNDLYDSRLVLGFFIGLYKDYKLAIS